MGDTATAQTQETQNSALTQNPLSEVLKTEYIDEALAEAAQRGHQDVLITVSVDEASYDPKTGQFNATPLTATYGEYQKVGGGEVYRTGQVQLPEGEEFSATTGKITQLFEQAAMPVIESNPMLSNLSSTLSKDQMIEMAGDQPVTASSQLKIIIDNTGEVKTIAATGSAMRGGQPVLDGLAYVNNSAIEMIADSKGIAYDGRELLDDIIEGEADLSKQNFAGIIEGGDLGMNVKIAPPSGAQNTSTLAAAAYLSNEGQRLLYSDVTVNPGAAAPESGVAEMSNIVSTMAADVLSEKLNMNIENMDALVGNPTGNITLKAAGIKSTGEGFKAQTSSLSGEFNGVTPMFTTLSKVYGLQGKLGEQMQKFTEETPNVDVSFNTGAPAPGS